MVDILRIEELGYAYLTYKKELINYGYEVRKISMKEKTIDIKKEICDHISLFVQILMTSYDLLANVIIASILVYVKC